MHFLEIENIIQMKHLYTITFESDSTSENEAEMQERTPTKPQRPTNTRTRPIPKPSQVKVITRNLSEESKIENYSPPNKVDSNTSHKKSNHYKKSHEYAEVKSNKYDLGDSSGIKLLSQYNNIIQKKQKNENEYDSNEYEYDEDEEEENEIEDQNKSRIERNPPSINDAKSKTPYSTNEIHPANVHRHIPQRNKHNSDDNNNFDQNHIDIQRPQEHLDHDISQNNNTNPETNASNNYSNEQNHVSEANSNNNNKLQSNSADSNLTNENIEQQESSEPFHFTIIRQMKTKSIFNKKTSFMFTDSNNNCLFEARPEKGSQSIMNIICGSQYDQVSSEMPLFSLNAQTSTNGQFGVIICSPEMDSFSLRLNNQYGYEVMSVRVDTKKCKNSSNSVFLNHNKHSTHNELNPNFDINGALRLIKANFFLDKSNKFENKLQNVESLGIELDFGDRNVVKSTKNFILVDSYRKEFIAIRKIEKNELCVDFHPSIPAFCAFALGLIACMYKA